MFACVCLCLVQWLFNEQLIPKLIAKLDPKYEHDSEVHVNAARALVDIVVKCPTAKPSMLVTHMKTPEVLDVLFRYLFAGVGLLQPITSQTKGGKGVKILLSFWCLIIVLCS